MTGVHLAGFVGYGPATRSVDVLFLGLEEKALEGKKNLVARSSFDQVEDVWDACHLKLEPAGCSNPFAATGDPVTQWNTAARFALAVEGHPKWHEHTMWSQYWRERLGRRNGNTFLMECFPFPRQSRNTPLPESSPWPDAELWRRRRLVLAAHLDQYPPEFAIAYGKATRAKAADLFSLPEAAWRSVPGVKHPASVASNGKTRVAHVGFFGQGLFASAEIPTVVAALRTA